MKRKEVDGGAGSGSGEGGPSADGTESRLRSELVREIHDGTLQILAGAGLKLETALRLLDRDPEAARVQLREVLSALGEEQRQLRYFVDTFGPGAPEAANQTLAEAMQRVSRRVRSIWGLDVRLRLRMEREPPPHTRHIICRMIQESAVNARRHGGAGRVDVAVTVDEERVTVRVEDDGQGFDFDGRWDHGALARERRGPVSLRRRLEALGGSLVIHSGPDGATLDMSFPRPDMGDAGTR